MSICNGCGTVDGCYCATPQQPAPGGPETEIESADRFTSWLKDYETTYTDALNAIARRDAQIAAQARAQALRDAESKWGADHSWDCAGMIDAADCTCGWAIALAAAHEPASDPQPETGRS